VLLILGKAYAPVITPPLYVLSGYLFWQIIPPKPKDAISLATGTFSDISQAFAKSLWVSFSGFFESIYQGGYIIFMDARYRWLIFGYTIPLVMHRYIESGVVSVYAKSVLKESAYASFINSGSNLGELLGALFVFFNLKLLATPITTVRWDALVLNLAWLFYNVVKPSVFDGDSLSQIQKCTGVMAMIMAFISAGWAAGDVSMAAYVQSSVPKIKIPGIKVANALPSVMSFLYVLQIVIFAVISPLIGNWLDSFEVEAKSFDALAKKATGMKKAEYLNKAANIRLDANDQYFYWIAGVLFSLVSVTIFLNTFLPKGSWKLNPTLSEIGEDDHQNVIPAAGTASPPTCDNNLTSIEMESVTGVGTI
jgi:hypothetical protein